MDMSNRGLTDLPSSIPTQEMSLDLSNNHFRTLRSNMFLSLTNLSTIRFSGNQISTIEPGAFNGVFLLQYLYLDVNVIETIQTNTFNSSVYLIELYLHNNKISTLQPGAFEAVFRLSILHLHANELSVLRADTFLPLRQLTHLYLSQNRMTTIENGTFNGLVKLCCLYLQYNELVQVPDIAQLHSLRHILMNSNPIHSITLRRIEQLNDLIGLHFSFTEIHPLPSLAHIRGLRWLSLAGMMLRHLPHYVLKGVATLKITNLSQNKLTHFPKFAESQRVLETIYLGTNRISHIPSLLPYKQLKHLNLALNYITAVPEAHLSPMAPGWVRLSGNPIPCVRQLCWLFTRDLPLQVELTCPDGRDWQQLNKEHICEGWSKQHYY